MLRHARRVARSIRSRHQQSACRPAFVESLEGRVVLSAGDLDPTFGAGGTVIRPVTDPSSSAAVLTTHAVDTRGGFTVVASSSRLTQNGQSQDFELFLDKLDDDGDPVAGFGAGGRLQLFDGVGPITNGNFTAITDVAIQADGKILVAAEFVDTGEPYAVLLRLNANGTVDTSFAGGMIDFAFSDVTSVDIASNNKIVVGGYHGLSLSNSRFAAARVNPNGTFDNTFSGDGQVILNSPGQVNDVAAQGDGKVVLAGQGYSAADASGIFRVIRLTNAGGLDAGFANAGTFDQFNGLNGGSADSVDVAPNGKIVVGGFTFEEAIYSLNPNGSVDFSRGAFLDLADSFRVNDIVATSDSRIVAWATLNQPTEIDGQTYDSAIVRLDADATFDLTFADEGVLYANAADFGDLQADKRVIAAGARNASGGDAVIVRRFLYDTPNADRIFARANGSIVVEGTTGNDTISFRELPASGGQPQRVEVRLNNLVETFPRGTSSASLQHTIEANFGDDRVTFAAYGAGLVANAGPGNDNVAGGNGNDSLTGGAGNDTLRGNGGNDWFDGGLGADDIGGGAGTDLVTYAGRTAALTVRLNNAADDGEANEKDNVRSDVENVRGGQGNDKLYGSAAANRLEGGNGDDQLFGGAGNDTLLGDGGRDTLRGEDNDDTLDGGAGADDLGGGNGNDTLDYTGRWYENLVISLDNIADDGAANERDFARPDNEVVRGGLGNDRITGNSAANVLYGGGGNDILIGGGGNDWLNGGAGLDELFGEGGNDRLFTRDGEFDRLNGGTGTDTAERDGGDSVTDIESFI